MLRLLPATVQGLREASTFQRGVEVALGPVVAYLSGELAAVSFNGRALRAVAHRRSESSYDTLAVCEADHAVAEPAEQLVSSNVWHWILEHDAPVEVNVLMGTASLLDRPNEPLSKDTQVSKPFEAGLSRQAMLARGTTHLVVFPLHDERSSLRGMVSVEVQARGEPSAHALWDRCAADLRTWLDAVGPYLCALPAEVANATTDPLLPVCGEAMAPIVRLLTVFAAQEETLLLSGPTGSGKSRLARYCHARSSRAGGPFEIVDLLSVPPDMQMGELVGWKKGAFTGADRDHQGSLARAERGTLFLDEIDKLSLAAQAGLLRLLETKQYRPLGSAGRERDADVRFIVGTNADLLAEVREGRFREDLYYRIQVLATRLPPLSRRTDEIVPWARHMLERRRAEAQRADPVVLTEEAAELLVRAPWPGNLRQLDNAVRRAFVLASAEAGASDPLLTVTAAHMQASLASEEPEGMTPMAAALTQAAHALLDALDAGAQLELEDATIFRAHVLGAAIARCKDVEESFRLLRRENLVRNRNHYKTVDRELQRVREFYAALGIAPPRWLIQALTR